MPSPYRRRPLQPAAVSVKTRTVYSATDVSISTAWNGVRVSLDLFEASVSLLGISRIGHTALSLLGVLEQRIRK